MRECGQERQTESARESKRGDRGERKRGGGGERERTGERERALVPCGRDSIKRTHINESFQGKTELYAGASISTRARHACTYTRALTRE